MTNTECIQCQFVNWPDAVTCTRCGAPLSGEKPPVWKWFALYSLLMALMYLALAVLGVFLLFAEPPDDMNEQEARLLSGFFILFGLLFCAPFAYGPFLPRKSWAWLFGMVLICVGLTSACCLPASIPLLIWWLKPDTKAYFGKFPTPPPPPPVPGAF